jgi:uncharacterized protein (DUF486 family)
MQNEPKAEQARLALPFLFGVHPVQSRSVSPGKQHGAAMPPALTTVFLLTISNLFMTIAWYGHLKIKSAPMWTLILMSWGIAFFEYVFQVPANRIGYQGGLSASQLKITQEAITLVIFTLFASFVLGEKITWNYYVGFGLVMLAVFFVYHKW